MVARATAEDEFYDIRILKDGTWLYQGSPIGRENLVRLFASVLKRDEKGDYWLETPAERGRITVDDAPFLAVAVEVLGAGDRQALVFTTNLGEKVTAGASHPVTLRPTPGGSGDRAPYILLARGLEARIARPVYYELAELAVRHRDNPEILGIWSQGRFFELGTMAVLQPQAKPPADGRGKA